MPPRAVLSAGRRSFASAIRIRSCHTFEQVCSMSEVWWTDLRKDSNGYFGCETVQDAPSVAGDAMREKVYFETKMRDERSQWLKFNIFTYWKAASNQMAILTFDAQPPVEEHIVELFTNLQTDNAADPFWIYRS
ncbi:hypothetical protein PG991_008923 [Apiospora marii]|uniref:Uncharacterized protein n=1 Tax=Apiospora marii TaxID=335849 RepID=A0ABR1RM48_9PEZI